ncbi:hypothetical protein [Acetobacter malorum]
MFIKRPYQKLAFSSFFLTVFAFNVAVPESLLFPQGRHRIAIMTLDDLGPRICIMGPSNSGKSTLADAISRARGLRTVHLDQLSHLPHTDWLSRSSEEFKALHDAELVGSSWVIEGNYSALLPQRLERATGFILLDVPTPVSLYRYLRRCWVKGVRLGALEGSRDSVKWSMIRHIIGATRSNRARYKRMFGDISLPKVGLTSTKALADFYRVNGLKRSCPYRHY